MKKGIVLLASLICAFTLGCTSAKEEKVGSLKDAYFNIGKKLEKKEEVTVEYVKELLKDYDYEKGDTVDNEKGYLGYEMHTFTKDKEKLIISDATYGGEKSLELYYLLIGELESASISYTPSSKAQRFYLYGGVSDINLYEEMSNMLDKKGSKLLNTYNKISKNIGNNKDITISDIEKMTDIKPAKEDTFDDTISKEVTYYTFTKGNDVMEVYCLKGEDKVSRVSFLTNNEPESLKDLMNSKTVNFMKGAFSKGYFEGREEALLNISMDVDSLAKQEKLLNLIFE